MMHACNARKELLNFHFRFGVSHCLFGLFVWFVLYGGTSVQVGQILNIVWISSQL